MVLAVTIFPDKSIFSVVVIFAILFMALNRVLFQPLFRVMDERSKRTDGVVTESKKTMERYSALLGQYESSIRTGRTECYKQQEQVRTAAVKSASEQIQQARREAEMLIDRAKQELLAQVEQAKGSLAADASATADMISQLILRRLPVNPERKERQS
ncbi:MAG: ATP synthase F0 subunit B [Acidobacteria bacterium]|nr:ATP synthase F0 subunit B [Acidobacteriota bacterium]MBI3655830.1 ATP synthase F0 subunit B [Acidobacteriota bacterium]